jgi:hypothetical protein
MLLNAITMWKVVLKNMWKTQKSCTQTVCVASHALYSFKSPFIQCRHLVTVFTRYPIPAVTKKYSVKWLLEYNARNLLMKARGCNVIFCIVQRTRFIPFCRYSAKTMLNIFSVSKKCLPKIIYSHTLIQRTPPPTPIYCRPRWMSLEICGQKFPIIQYIDLTPPSIYRHKLRWTNNGDLSRSDSLCF